MQAAIGAVQVARVEEYLGLGFAPKMLFPAFQPEMVAPLASWLVPRYYDPAQDRLRTSIHSWVVRTAWHTILIDTCVGNSKERPQIPRFHRLDTQWLDHLREAGVRPEDVDFVMCTHLHADHVGWNTHLVDGRWKPTFPNARYIFGREEFARWDSRLAGYDHRHVNDNVFEDSILPVAESGRMVLVDDGYTIDGALTVEPAPGHTRGHVRIRLRSQGQEALFSGDIAHHPLQVYHPELYTPFDDDPAQGIATRLRLLEDCVARSAVLFPTHFAEPHMCRIRGTGNGYSIDWG